MFDVVVGDDAGEPLGDAAQLDRDAVGADWRQPRPAMRTSPTASGADEAVGTDRPGRYRPSDRRGD